jgi:hypothetical protein
MALTVNKTLVKPLPGAIVRTIKLAEACSAGQALCPNASGDYVKADADGAGLFRATCLLINGSVGDGNVSGDFASGASASAVFFGPVAGIDGMDTQKSVWNSTTAGGLTQTKPSGGGVFPAPMGYPLAADVLMIAPQPQDTTY